MTLKLLFIHSRIEIIEYVGEMYETNLSEITVNENKLSKGKICFILLSKQ